MQICVLASGSTGNAMVVKNKEVTLLIDAGLSAKKLEELLDGRNGTCAEIDAILITHEHADHIKGLGAVARRYELPVYANQSTWDAMERQVGELKEHQRVVFETGSLLDFGLIQVESFPISHDAAEPVGYSFFEGDQKVSLATDLGYVSPKVREKVIDSDILIFESNHDIEMLRIGRYPWNIKRRILGDTGHLSNEAAGEALSELITERTKRVYLAHLSRDHNMMDLAKLTVNNILKEQGILDRHRKLRLMDTFYDRPTLWDDVDQA